jgi:S-adenosylmethionine:tRNA ribosyltransferase-isomerase
MPLVDTRIMFSAAYKNGFAIGAFNVNNMELLQGIVGGVTEKQAPLILQISKGARKYANMKYLRALIDVAVSETDIPIVVHLDHGDTFELCKDRLVEFYQNDKKIDFLELVDILNEIGHIPLPPYINREDEKLDENEYQTVFAENPGAVAAPTASLHFTDELISKIKNKSFLTLHVGAGTFKPVEVENILEHPMHSEFFEIPEATAKILDSDIKITAVGTTATRTIEYYAREKKLFGECDLFLHPQNKPIRVNNLLTNFHLPKSTLIMLVSAFIGREKALELYEVAIKEKYRFYSYGDAMLII